MINKICFITLFIVFTACIYSFSIDSNPSNKGPEIFGAGFSVGLSTGVYTPMLKMVSFIKPEIFARFFNKLEISASAAMNSSVNDNNGLLEFEIRFAPEIGAYQPYTGIGYYIMFLTGRLSGNQGLYSSSAPLRFSLDSLIQLEAVVFNNRLNYGLLISFLECKMGPFVTSGPRWALNIGNFIMETELIKIYLKF